MQFYDVEHIHKYQLDPAWQGWVKESIDRRCDPNEILSILLQNKFSIPAIRRAMGSYFPERSPHIAALPAVHPAWEDGVTPNIDHQSLCTIPMACLSRHPGFKLVETDKLQIATLDNFLSGEECDLLISLIDKDLQPSGVFAYAEGARTSMTSNLLPTLHADVARIEERICLTIGIRNAYSEGIQAHKYTVGQEFKPHTDFFKPMMKDFIVPFANGANRTWTFMTYLSDTPKGGGTHFLSIDKTFYPKKGMAVAWNNLYADGTPNPDTAHWGMPVEEGEKYIFTKWFREEAGPMLYEHLTK